MSLLLGIDLGTSKITAVVFDPSSGSVVAREALSNDSICTAASDRARGRSEWNPLRIVDLGFECIRRAVASLGRRAAEIAAVGVTGQQHGILFVDDQLQPLTPLVNWQDRRGNELVPGEKRTYVDAARSRIGDADSMRCGCRLQSGFAGTTLYWMRRNGVLPVAGQVCFIMDFFAARLAGCHPVCEPSAAGSSGVFDVHRRDWNETAIAALELPRSMFPPIQESHAPLGILDCQLAQDLRLRPDLRVFPALGDHQASYVGAVTQRDSTILVNVGTGAQVAIFSSGFDFAPPVELRPFPNAGNLLSNVGLAGGWSYQLLEQFFESVSRDVLGLRCESALYATLNRLAGCVPSGADGLLCEPTFSGTRSDPGVRGAFSGISSQNFTPAHFARALLEGMARTLFAGFQTIASQAPEFRPDRIVAAGNGLRENPLLGELVRTEFGLPMTTTTSCEEAAVGAALAASVGAGMFRDIEAASATLSY